MDEYDDEQKLIIEHEDGSIIVNARLDVDKLEDFLQIELPEGDFESVGGFIISLIGKVPEVNEKILYNDIEILIEAATSRKIDRVRIRKLGKEVTDEPSVEEPGR